MKIALINENSQASKNSQIYEVLKDVASKYNHEVFNYGMYSQEDQETDPPVGDGINNLLNYMNEHSNNSTIQNLTVTTFTQNNSIVNQKRGNHYERTC